MTVLSTNGVWEPNPLNRDLSGEYTCRLDDATHSIVLNVFPSEVDRFFGFFFRLSKTLDLSSWEHYINGEGANLTLSVADFDMSEDLFADPGQ